MVELEIILILCSAKCTEINLGLFFSIIFLN